MMAPTPLVSPYGSFQGTLFQYHPPLVAFESSPPSPGHEISSKKLILLGGLSDGLIPTPYTSDLTQTCVSLGWSVVQPIISSSHLGFGNGSLKRDTDEIGYLMRYLKCHRSADAFAIVGHSTGCQNAVHFLKFGDEEMIQSTKFIALQAPVSDREGPNLKPEYDGNIQHARDLVSQNKGDEMMPRNSFWAPITASRFLSLQDVGGEDDFFSSDLKDEEMIEKLGHIGKIGEANGLKALVAYSGSDEYVPDHVDKDLLLERLCWAMNGGETTGNAAIPLMLKKGNHNLSAGEGDKETFVKEIAKIINSI